MKCQGMHEWLKADGLLATCAANKDWACAPAAPRLRAACAVVEGPSTSRKLRPDLRSARSVGKQRRSGPTVQARVAGSIAICRHRWA
eukprot:scaffold27570_cov34-Tisochrysis_lutea.AAC.3